MESRARMKWRGQKVGKKSWAVHAPETSAAPGAPRQDCLACHLRCRPGGQHASPTRIFKAFCAAVSLQTGSLPADCCEHPRSWPQRARRCPHVGWQDCCGRVCVCHGPEVGGAVGTYSMCTPGAACQGCRGGGFRESFCPHAPCSRKPPAHAWGVRRDTSPFPLLSVVVHSFD